MRKFLAILVIRIKILEIQYILGMYDFFKNNTDTDISDITLSILYINNKLKHKSIGFEDFWFHRYLINTTIIILLWTQYQNLMLQNCVIKSFYKPLIS